MIWLVVAAIAAAVGAGAVVAFWPTIVNKLQAWLRENNLTKSALAEAVVRLDRMAGHVRRILRVRTRAYGVQKISEEQLSLDDIDDPQLRAELERTGNAERDVLHLLD
ncbi:hypothetical protein [Luedemannella helvata]|uniref:Uncharacterized protein n=1 Tax=Luedemannella helvata TaxID=349315 RepID=A0ABN2L733_9ACTN